MERLKFDPAKIKQSKYPEIVAAIKGKYRTLTAFAEANGSNIQYVCRTLRGYNISWEIVDKICDEFGFSREDFPVKVKPKLGRPFENERPANVCRHCGAENP